MPKRTKKRNSKTTKKLSRNSINSKKILVFAAVFGLFGILGLYAAFANPSASLEVENARLNACAKTISDQDASGSRAVRFGCDSQSNTREFIHPGVVYTQSDIDTWSTNSSEYSRLASTGAGSLTTTSSRYQPIVFGSQINTSADKSDPASEMNAGLKDQSGFAKVQAVLYRADDNQARKQKVIDYLKEYRSVTSIERASGEQHRLVAGWGCTNLAQAAELVDYQDTQFKRFLKDVCYPIMDWTNGPNWHASFADSKLAIAAYLGDAELWTDAKAYYYERIAQSIYHSDYDNGFVSPLHVEDTDANNIRPRLHDPPGTPKANYTAGHWGAFGGWGQIDTSLKAEYPAGVSFPDGTNAERRRDYGHVNMGLAGWLHGARTIEAQGEELAQHAYDRLLAGYTYHAAQVLEHTRTGVYPEPVPVRGDGGESRFKGYHGAKVFFASDTPDSVDQMLARSEVKNQSAAGALHFVAEAFADGTGGRTEQPPALAQASGEVNASSSGEYNVWVRMRAASDSRNSVQLELGGETFRVADTRFSTTGWTWIDWHSGDSSRKMRVSLSSGTHTITLTEVTHDLLVDKVLILNTDCRPVRDGANCINTPPEVSLLSPQSGEVFAHDATINLTASATDTDGTISKVEFLDGNEVISTDTSAPFSYEWRGAATGAHNLFTRAYDDKGATTLSSLVSIQVTAPPSEPEPIAAPTGFEVSSRSGDSISLRWDKASDSRVDSYSIRYIAADSPDVNNYSKWIYPRVFEGNSITIDGLNPRTEYLFQLRARVSQGTSSGSDDDLSPYTQTLSAKTRSGGKWWDVSGPKGRRR